MPSISDEIKDLEARIDSLHKRAEEENLGTPDYRAFSGLRTRLREYESSIPTRRDGQTQEPDKAQSTVTAPKPISDDIAHISNLLGTVKQRAKETEELDPADATALKTFRQELKAHRVELGSIVDTSSDSESDTEKDPEPVKKKGKTGAKDTGGKRDKGTLEAERNAVADERINKIFSAPLRPPLAADKYVLTLMQPNLSMNTAHDLERALLDTAAGFGAPPAGFDWPSLLRPLGLLTAQQVKIPTVVAAANHADPAKQPTIMQRDVELASVEATSSAQALTADTVVYAQSVKFAVEWDKMEKGERTRHNQELFFAYAPKLFKNIASKDEKHNQCKGKKGKHRGEYKKFSKNVRDPCTTTRTQLLNLYTVFGTAALLNTSITSRALGRKSAKLTRLSERIKHYMRKNPATRKAVQAREETHRQILTTLLRNMVAPEDKENIGQFIRDFYNAHPPFKY